MHFFTVSGFGSTIYPNPDSLIEYPLPLVACGQRRGVPACRCSTRTTRVHCTDCQAPVWTAFTGTVARGCGRSCTHSTSTSTRTAGTRSTSASSCCLYCRSHCAMLCRCGRSRSTVSASRLQSSSATSDCCDSGSSCRPSVRASSPSR